MEKGIKKTVFCLSLLFFPLVICAKNLIPLRVSFTNDTGRDVEIMNPGLTNRNVNSIKRVACCDSDVNIHECYRNPPLYSINLKAHASVEWICPASPSAHLKKTDVNYLGFVSRDLPEGLAICHEHGMTLDGSEEGKVNNSRCYPPPM